MVKISHKDDFEGTIYITRVVVTCCGLWLKVEYLSSMMLSTSIYSWRSKVSYYLLDSKREASLLVLKFHSAASLKEERFMFLIFPSFKGMMIKLTLENYKVKWSHKVFSKQ